MRTPLLRRLERTRAEAQLPLAAQLSESDRALVARAMALLAVAGRRDRNEGR